MIHQDHQDDLTLLRLDHGKASALDLEFCNAIADAIIELDARAATRAIVLTGTGSIFSAGVDLFRIVENGAEYVRAFLPALDRVFHSLFACRKPVVGAVNGHAIAGGAIMALCCDHRVMAEGNGRIGTPELLVGVPYPAIVIEIMRFALPARQLQRTAYMGESLLPADALARGLVDEVVAADVTVERAFEVARAYAAVPAASWELTKRQLRGPALDSAAARSSLAPEIEATWSSPEVLGGIQDYLDRTVKRKQTLRN